MTEPMQPGAQRPGPRQRQRIKRSWRHLSSGAGHARRAFPDATLGQVNALLRQHFQANGARPDELPDHPVML